LASRIKTILAKRLFGFVSDALPQKAADREQSSVMIPRAPTRLGAGFGEKTTDSHITFAVKREPVARRIVFTVAHDIYDNWFEVEPMEEEKEKFNEAVQKVLFQLNAKDVFTQAAVCELYPPQTPLFFLLFRCFLNGFLPFDFCQGQLTDIS